MELTLAFVIIALTFVVPGANAGKPYDGYQLFSFKVKTQNDVETLQDLVSKLPQLDVWTHPRPGRTSTVLVSPSLVTDVIKHMEHAKVTWSVRADVQSLVDHEALTSTSASINRLLRMIGGDAHFEHSYYRSYTQVGSFLDSLRQKFPRNVYISDLNHKTHENRSVTLVQISGGLGVTDKPAIVIESGIHAREWISPAATLFAIEKILTDYTTGKDLELLKKFDWFFIPVTNPDGYEYTWNGKRFWRKNKRQVSPECVGVDLNRNFDFKFGTTGVSQDCQSGRYPGDSGFSEPETRNIRDLVTDLRPRLIGYLGVHAYSQVLLKPWAYVDNEYGNETKPANYQEMDRVGRLMQTSLTEKFGTNYSYGTPKETIGYGASGSSMDWVKATAPNVYTFAYELRPSYDPTKGVYAGFVLPSDQIVPTGEEFYSSLLTFAKEIKTYGTWSEY